MRRDRRRAAWVLAAVLAAVPAAAAEAPDGGGTEEAPTPASRVERLGDGMPPGAILRIGVRSFRHGGEITALAFASDGRTLCSAGGDASVRVWEYPSGREQFAIRVSDGSSVDDLALSPDGSRIVAVCGDGALFEWAAADGSLLRKTASEQALTGVAFSPDGRHLLTSGNDGTLFIRKGGTGELIRPLKVHVDEICRPAVTPDGSRIYTGGSDRKVRAWDLATGTLLGTWSEHGDAVTAVSISPDGRCVATADDEGWVLLRDPDTGRVLRRIGWASECVAALAFSGDSGQLAVATDEGIHLVSMPDGEITQTLACEGDGVTVLVFAPGDGSIAAATGNRILFWDLAPGPVMLERRFGAFGDRGAIAVAVTPDGRMAAIQSQDRGIVLWDIVADREIRCIDHPAEPVLVLAFSPDGEFLAGGAPQPNPVQVWAVATGAVHRKLDKEARSFAFVPGSGHRMVVAGDDGRLTLLDVATGERVTERKAPGDAAVGVTRMWPSPDGTTLAVLTADSAIGVLALPGLDRGRRLAKCDETVHAAAFSADGRRLVLGDASGNVTLWSVADGRLIFEGKDRLNGSPIAALAFVPGEDRFLSLSQVSEEPWAIWDPGKPDAPVQETFRGGTGDADRATVLTDGRIVSGSSGEPHLSLWRTGSGRRARARAIPGFVVPPERILFSADGRSLVAPHPDGRGGTHVLRFFDAVSGAPTGEAAVEDSPLIAFTCPEDGGILGVSQDGKLRRWSLPGGSLVGDVQLARSQPILAAAFSADGRRLVASTQEQMIHWDVPGGRAIRVIEGLPSQATLTLDLFADGRTVMRQSDGQRLETWDLTTGSRTGALDVDLAAGQLIGFLHDGASALVVRQENAIARIVLMDPVTWKKAVDLMTGSGGVSAGAVRPDGAAVAVATTGGCIALCEPWTGARLHAFEPTPAPVLALAFSADGRRLAVSFADATLVVYDVSAWAGERLPRVPATEDGMASDWDALGKEAEDAMEAYRAMARMAGRGEDAVRFLAVRMKAIPAAPDRLPRWLRELDDDSVEVRERAMAEMQDLAPEAEPALREARGRATSPELVNRLDRILEGLAKHPPSETGLRRARAVRVLGRIGTPGALQALEAVEARALFRAETDAARSAIGRLRSRRP